MRGKVLIIKKNNKIENGFFGFIECTNQQEYFFDNRGIIKSDINKIIAGSYVDFELGKKQAKQQGKDVYAKNIKLINFMKLQGETKQQIKTLLLSLIEEKQAISIDDLQNVLVKTGINYEDYNISLIAFIEKEFEDTFEIKHNLQIGERAFKDAVVINKDHFIKNELIKLQKLFSEAKYEEILSSNEIFTITPDKMGSDSIILLVRAVAGYLKEKANIEFNDFQRNLIETERALGLLKFKDNDKILMQGVDTSFVSMPLDVFKKNYYFSFYHGKNNLNNNWRALAERHWDTNNELAFYYHTLWMLHLKSEECIEDFVSKSVKVKKIKRIVDLLNIYNTFCNKTNSITTSAKRNIIANCLACADVETLCKAIELFDDNTIPEAKSLVPYLRESIDITSEKLISYFHSDIGAETAEHLINYFWYKKTLKNEAISDTMIAVLSTVLDEFPIDYFATILEDDYFAGFGKTRKKEILLRSFEYICEFVKIEKKAYMLANYIHENIPIALLRYTVLTSEKYEELWKSISEWLCQYVKEQLTVDLKTAAQINFFKFNDKLKDELENYYCETYIKPQLECCTNDSDFDDTKERYMNCNVDFVAQWVKSNYRVRAADDINTLCEDKKFADAILWVKGQNTYDSGKKEALLQKIICDNFKILGFNEAAFAIFSKAMIPEEAEEILLNTKETVIRDAVLKSLFLIYIYQKDWLKVAYLYLPYNAHKKDKQASFYNKINSILMKNRISINNSKKSIKTHFDVIRVALKILNKHNFDFFMKWARKIIIPYSSKAYDLKSKTKPLDGALKEMLDGRDDTVCWTKMLKSVLLSDNFETQDLIRYTIIVAFIDRFGYKQFEGVLNEVVENRKNSEKDYYGYYNSVWKGVLTGGYSCNLLALNCSLIAEAPLTYWNLFYDVAVCKNHAFDVDKLWGTYWLQDFQNEEKRIGTTLYSTLPERYAIEREKDVQSFYNSLLERYEEEREPIFLQIAAKLLVQYNGEINPYFEKYLSYCNSNKTKDFLFQAIIAMLDKKSYMRDIALFLETQYWYLNETERKINNMLQLFCEYDYSRFNETLDLNFDEYLYERFRQDFLKIFATYPMFDIVKILELNNDSKLYQYALIKHTFKIKYDYTQFKAVLKKILITPLLSENNYAVFKSYLEIMNLCYREQVQNPGKEDDYNKLLWIQNRYHRILAASILLSTNLEEYDDEDIIILMQNGKHDDVFENYNRFRTALFAFVKSNNVEEDLRKLVLLSVVANEWDEFINNIDKFDIDTLVKINNMMELTNYIELNMSLIEKFIKTKDTTFSEETIKKIESCSPKIGFVLRNLLRVKQSDNEKQYDLIFTNIYELCRLNCKDKRSISFENLRKALLNRPTEIKQHWKIYMNALWATSYKSTIIGILGDKVRSNNVGLPELSLWKDVLDDILHANIYYYLVALRYAIEDKRENAKEAYLKIIDPSVIPIQWNVEKGNLKSYIQGESKKFIIAKNAIRPALNKERDAKDINFVQLAAQKQAVSKEEAISAYEQILVSDGSSNPFSVLTAFKILFSYVHSPNDLADLYNALKKSYQQRKYLENEKDKRIIKRTYNELLITFGALIIITDNELFTYDQKFFIFAEIIKVYELLNDANKEKSSIKELLKVAESYVFERGILSLSIWLSNFERIQEIVRHPVIGNQEIISNTLIDMVNSCKNAIAGCKTQMKILEKLTEWKNNTHIPPDSSYYIRTFFESVKSEIVVLKHGPQLNLKTLNEVIEDSHIFYQIESIDVDDNVMVSLNNRTDHNSASLQVLIGINGESIIEYENSGFSNIVELRPGDLCGQAYKLHSSILNKVKDGDRLEIILNIVVNGEIICNNEQNSFIFKEKIKTDEKDSYLVPGLIPFPGGYEFDLPAFTNKIDGVGRGKDQLAIQHILNGNDLLILYGASRVGKSSLLNFIQKTFIGKVYCKEKEGLAIASIMVAGVGHDTGNENDYEKDMLDSSRSIFNYNSEQMMEYLFIAPLLKLFNEEQQDGRCLFFGKDFPLSAYEEINGILARKLSVVSKYEKITKILEKNNCEIWLLYDEFQQIIKRHDGVQNGFDTTIFQRIKSENIKRIKIILCGSDELLRLFEITSDHKWDNFRNITSDIAWQVAPLERPDFKVMMEDKKTWKSTQPFSDEAIELLYRYTGGNAICGKIFGKKILEDLRNGYFKNRIKIYPSDVTRIAYELLNSDTGVLQTELIANTTKNLDNEKKYLFFIANELMVHPDQLFVSYSKIKEFFVTRGEGIDFALKMLVARGILKKEEHGKNSYGFTTMFYYDFYKSSVTEELMHKLREEELHVEQTIPSPETNIQTTIQQAFSQIKDNESKFNIAWMLYGNLEAPESQRFRDNIGKQTQNNTFIKQDGGSTLVTGNNTGEISTDNRSLTINAQTINTAFNTLLSPGTKPEDLIDAFKHLPTLSAYIGEEQRQQIEMRKKDIEKDYAEYENCSNEELKADISMRIAKKEEEIEQITAEPKQKMLNDTIGGAVSAVGTDAFMNVDEEKWKELLHISSNNKVRELMSLPVEFSTPLTFAVVLHNIFENIYKKVNDKENESDFMEKDFSSQKLDFCPVAIMYCKVIEAILKRKHTVVYVNALGKKTVKPNGILFEALKTKNGIDTENKDLTIGSFVSHLVFLDKKKYNLGSPNNDETMIKPKETDFVFGCKRFGPIIENYDENIKRLIEQSDGDLDDDELLKKWKTHARCLKIIELIRNRSAHEAVPITKANFDWLIEILFRKNEMIRVWKELIGA